MMVLASLLASISFQASMNPPRQFRPDAGMGHGRQSPVQLMYQEQLLFLLNSIVSTYSRGLVMLMLFQSPLTVERTLGKEGFCKKSKRGLLCGNIFLLLPVFGLGLGSADCIYHTVLPLFGYCVLFCTMYDENIRDKCKEWWKKLREVLNY